MLKRLESPRFAIGALAFAIIAYAALVLWLTRGASFALEEITYVGESKGIDAQEMLMPYQGGHLIAVTRLLFEVNLRIFGPEHLPFQLVVIALTATTSALVFALVRTRVGSAPALAAAVLLLFLGTTPEVIHGWATMWVQSTAAGLGALVALERDSRRGDLLACALLSLAVASFSVGVAFAIGAAAFILANRDRRRLWIPLVPLALYAVWWIWAQQFDEGMQSIANVLLAPVWALDSLAAGTAALTGVGVDLTTNQSDPSLIDLGWGRIGAAALLLAVAMGIRRRGSTPLFWASALFLLSLWLSQVLSYSPLRLVQRTPDLDRYAYPIAIGIVLVLAASFGGWKPSRPALLALAAATVFALPVNLWMMRERGAAIRTESELARARLTAIEIGRDVVSPDLIAIGPEGGIVYSPAGAYLAAVDRFGSFGYTDAELAAAAPEVRAVADETLGSIAEPTLEPAGNSDCSGNGPVEVRERTLVRSDSGGTVGLRRFADAPTVTAGELKPGRVAAIEVPPDSAPQPWIASIAADDLEECEPRK